MSGLTIAGRWYQNQDIIYPLTVSSDGALVTIPYNTESTHAGLFFYASTYNAALASAGTLDVLMVTGTKTCHFAFDVNAGGAGTIALYEAATYSAAGTPLTVFNANRQSSNTAVTTFTTAPTITGTGTTLLIDYVPGGTTGNAVGSSSANIARITEFDAKLNTAYLFRFTNLAAGAQPVSLTVGFFEGALT